MYTEWHSVRLVLGFQDDSSRGLTSCGVARELLAAPPELGG